MMMIAFVIFVDLFIVQKLKGPVWFASDLCLPGPWLTA